jgi:hypothetical protein
MHDAPDGSQVATAKSIVDGRKLRVVGYNAFAEMQKTLRWETTKYVEQELKRLFP